MTTRSRGTLIAAGIMVLAIGLCVRFPITSVSPILTSLGDHFGLGETGLAILTATPVLLFGLASPIAPFLVRRLGLEGALLLLLIALAVAGLLRPLSTPLLFVGTVVVGAAIALLGILAPQLIRHFLDKRAGLWTGIYTTSFGISAAVGPAATVEFLEHPLAELGGNRVGCGLSAEAAAAGGGLPITLGNRTVDE